MLQAKKYYNVVVGFDTQNCMNLCILGKGEEQEWELVVTVFNLKLKSDPTIDSVLTKIQLDIFT